MSHRTAEGVMSTQPITVTDDLALAIKEFETQLPGWWWMVCVCSVSRDASCGPDIAGPDADLLNHESRVFDEGFHCDDGNGTLASSLRDVMRQALEMKAKAHAGDHIPLHPDVVTRLAGRAA